MSSFRQNRRDFLKTSAVAAGTTPFWFPTIDAARAAESQAELKEKPLPENLLQELYKGKKPGGRNAHMRNFMECVQDRSQPISDVFTHHRAMTTCHLANIAIRLGKKLTWEPKTERIVGDTGAQQWQAREQRKGYEIKV